MELFLSPEWTLNAGVSGGTVQPIAPQRNPLDAPTHTRSAKQLVSQELLYQSRSNQKTEAKPQLEQREITIEGLAVRRSN